MHSKLLLTLSVAAMAAWSTSASAQGEARVGRIGPRAFGFSFDDDQPRAVIGISTSSGSARDTLGLLVSSVSADGPAEKAGIEEGNRIASINGIDLSVSRDDAGDEFVSQAKAHRLQRELEKLKPGDDVELRVYSEGKTRMVKVKTVALSSLKRGRAIFMGDVFTLPRIAPMPPMSPMPPMPAIAPRMRITRVTM